MLKKKDLIFVAGHNGFVGKAICRRLKFHGFNNILIIDKKTVNYIYGTSNTTKGYTI